MAVIKNKNMDDKTLLKISLVISVAGMIGLFIITQFIEVEEKNISDLEIGDYVKITGRVSSIASSGNNIFFEIEDQTGRISAVMFKPSHLEENMVVEVEGEVTKYNGKKEIVVDSIKK